MKNIRDILFDRFFLLHNPDDTLTDSRQKTYFLGHSTVFAELIYVRVHPIHVGVGTVAVADESEH